MDQDKINDTTWKELVVYYHPACREHDPRGHIENPERLLKAMEILNSAGVWSMADLRGQSPASENDISSVHTTEYLLRVKNMCARGAGMLGDGTPACQRSYEAALLAAGGALAAVDSVLTGAYKRALALVRPPGHHALPDGAMGFCIFNNIALAARRAQVKYNLKRIMILDWDAHHGNGVQRIFYSDPGVLYCSMHRDFSYPATGWAERVGEGGGRGYNVNVPLPLRSGDADYRVAWKEIVVPLAGAYRPELVLVCAGFDAHAGDPIGGMNLTDRGFQWLFQKTLEVAEKYTGGRAVAVLEGGYNPAVLGRNLVHVIRNWSGKTREQVELPGMPKGETLQAVAKVKKAHAKYWESV